MAVEPREQRTTAIGTTTAAATLNEDHLGRPDGHVGGAERPLHRAEGAAALREVGGDLDRPPQRGRRGQRLVEAPRALVARAGERPTRRRRGRSSAWPRALLDRARASSPTRTPTPTTTPDERQQDHRVGDHGQRSSAMRSRRSRVRGLEHVAGELDAGVLELLGEARAHAGRLQPALVAAVGVDAGPEVEQEDVLEGDLVALHPVDLGDVGDAAGAVPESGQLHDQVDRGGDLLTDGPDGQVEAGHEGEGLDAAQGVAGAVGVHRGHRAVVAGVHRLEHVEGLAAAALADDDAVGTHPEAVLDEVADRDLAGALDVRRTGLHAEHVPLVELELLGVLDGDDALAVRDERRQDVEERGLAGAGAAGHEDVELALDAGAEEPDAARVEGPEAHEVGGHEGLAGELPDGEERAVDRERRDDGVHAGAVGEAGVDHRRRLVDAATDVRDDLVDHPADVLGVDEAGRDLHDLALALAEHDVRTVDHHLGDAVVVQELLDRSVADDVVADVLGELLVELAVGGDPGLLEGRDDDLAQVLLELVVVDAVVEQHRPQVPHHPLVDLGVDVGREARPRLGRGGRRLGRQDGVERILGERPRRRTSRRARAPGRRGPGGRRGSAGGAGSRRLLGTPPRA